MKVNKISGSVRVSREALDDAQPFREMFDNWLAMSPDERLAQAAQAKESRAVERAAADVTPLTFDAVLDKLGWSREYAEHFVQGYCYCSDGSDGWDYCAHARDLGLTDG